MIKKLFSLISIFGRKDSFKFLSVVLLTIITSFFEVIGIGLLAIFALSISDPNIFLNKIFITDLKYFLEQLEKIDLILFYSISILIIFLIKHLINFGISFFEIKVTKKIIFHLKDKIFKYFLSSEYENFLNKNKSDLINIVSTQTSNFMGYVHNVLIILKELILISIIFISMMIIDWEIILFLTFVLFFFTYLFIKIFKKKLNDIGNKSRILQEQEIKQLDETYQSFKIIKLEGKENFFSVLLNSIVQKKNYYEIIHYLIGKLPKIFLEIIILVIFFGTVSVLILRDPNNSEVIGTVTFFAFAIIRMMPAFISMNNAYTSLAFFRPSFEIIYSMINSIKKDRVHIEEKKIKDSNIGSTLEEININDLNFSYRDSNKIILKNINLTIKKNDILGITGPSGSGKSTFLHLLIGLLKPNSGEILFNNKILKNNKIFKNFKISYISQDNFILDGSLSENIAFGEKKKEEKRIIDSINFSNLNDFADTYQTITQSTFGYSGSKLSHGQKQRIGLARAYYANSDLIIFDESLNALDHKNENIILKNISKLRNKILIFVAHRTETLRYCNKLLIMKDGKVLDYGITKDIIKKNPNLEKFFKNDSKEN